jgi:predicted AAA+ superfamily ATPase
MRASLRSAEGKGIKPREIGGGSLVKSSKDTLLGHFLLPFSHSFRKKLIKSPKFYFFDTGVARSAARTLSVALVPGTSIYGEVFEQFIVTQCIHTLKYRFPDAKVMFYKDENNIEVDLVVEKPGHPLLFVEIKSTNQITGNSTKNLKTVRKDFPDARLEVWSQDKVKRNIEGIALLPWQDGLRSI